MVFMGVRCFQRNSRSLQKDSSGITLFPFTCPLCVSQLLFAIFIRAGSYSKFCTEVTATGAEILVMEMERWKEAQKLKEKDTSSGNFGHLVFQKTIHPAGSCRNTDYLPGGISEGEQLS